MKVCRVIARRAGIYKLPGVGHILTNQRNSCHVSIRTAGQTLEASDWSAFANIIFLFSRCSLLTSFIPLHMLQWLGDASRICWGI